MERDSSKLMTPFDCHTIPHWIYILKLLLPYTPMKFQHSLAIFIRFQEMQLTMKHFRGFQTGKSTDNFIHDVKPYMDSATQEMIEQLESMISMMEMLQSMQESSHPSDNPQNINPMDFLAGFSDSNLFDIFNMKGDINHE